MEPERSITTASESGGRACGEPRLVVIVTARSCSCGPGRIFDDGSRAWSVIPSLEVEYRRALKQRADEEAVRVFARNLTALLLAPPLGGKPVGNNRFYGANDPRRNSGLALGY